MLLFTDLLVMVGVNSLVRDWTPVFHSIVVYRVEVGSGRYIMTSQV